MLESIRAQMNITVTATQSRRLSNCIEMESVPCPRCGSLNGKTIAKGRDYIHNIPGWFFAWQCAGCDLQYQNPRPIADCLPQLYPADYWPHSTTQSVGWKERLKRQPTISNIWPLLRAGRAGLRFLHRRIGVGSFGPDSNGDG